MLFNIGAFIGASLGGFLYEAFLSTPSLPFLPFLPLPGVALPFLVSSLFGIITTTLVLLFVLETRPEPARVEA